MKQKHEHQCPSCDCEEGLDSATDLSYNKRSEEDKKKVRDEKDNKDKVPD